MWRAARKLGIDNPRDVYYLIKPKRMHRTTFERLTRELSMRRYEQLEALAAWTGHVRDRLNALETRSERS